MEEVFGQDFEGYGATTLTDKHGDIFTLEHLRLIKDNFDEKKGGMNLLSEHNPKEVIGKIFSMEIEKKKEGWAALKIKGKIFKGKEKEFEKMKNKRGLSIAILYSNCKLTEEEILNANMKIEVSPYFHREFEELLDSLGINYGVHLRKAADIPTIISLVNLAILGLYKLIDLLVALREQKVKEKEKQYITETINEIREIIKMHENRI